MRDNTFMEPVELSLPHLIRHPKVSLRHAPLLLLLHGQESSEKDIFNIAAALDERFMVVCPRGIFYQVPGRYNWFQTELVSGSWITNSIQAEFSRQALLKFADEAAKAYRTDPSQTYLLGYCQGAVMTLDMILSQSSRFAGVGAISGQLLPEMRSSLDRPNALHGFPVICTHGINDEIYPVKYGRTIRDTLTSWGINLTYREYMSGHFITPEILADVRAWLSARLDEKGVIATPTSLGYQLTLGHIEIKVRGLERSIAFYTRFLGLSLVERTGNAYAFLSSGDKHHEIALQNVGSNAPIPPDHSAGLGNLAFHVPDPISFAQAYQSLKNTAIPVSLVDHQIGWGILFTDPDGNGIEIYCDMRGQPGHARLWQGRDLPLDPVKVLAWLEKK
jgi:predicted esterase/catechol 2,3-dioxygenase-like lactoylglutathione lyase family enzyme